MRAGLTDEEIITGLRNRDSEITKTYFYGYCRIAYYIYQQKYELQLKPKWISTLLPTNTICL